MEENIVELPAVTKQKILGTTNHNRGKKIIVTHITIRQSISVLIFRMLLIELFTALAVILLHTLILSTEVRDLSAGIPTDITLFNIPVFLVLVALKTALVIFVLIQWLNEYYEITPKEIVHKSGLIFRKEQYYKMEHLGSVRMEQGVLGRLFNYGNLRIYNWALEKDFLMYLIHNPHKYHLILDTLLPTADREKEVLREHILEAKDE